MTQQYTISGGAHSVTVAGTMADNQQVTVTVDGDTITIPAKGTIKETPATYEVTTPDGAHVVEKPGVQKITHPDGLTITKKPGKKTASLPDGTTITEKPGKTVVNGSTEETTADTETNTDVSVSTSSTSNSSTSVEVSNGSVHIEHTSTSTTSNDNPDKSPATFNLLDTFFPGPELVAIAGTGILLDIWFITGIAVLLYGLEVLEDIKEYRSQLKHTEPDSDTTSDNTEFDSDLSETERREKELEQAYVEGDLTDEEFENALDRLHFEDTDPETTEQKTTEKELA